MTVFIMSSGCFSEIGFVFFIDSKILAILNIWAFLLIVSLLPNSLHSFQMVSIREGVAFLTTT